MLPHERISPRRWLWLLPLVLAAFACSGRGDHKPVPPHMPAWCVLPSGVHPGPELSQPVIRGVGSISGVNAPEIAKDKAEHAARMEITRLFTLFKDEALRTYRLSGGANLPAVEEGLPGIEAPSSVIDDRYVDNRTNTWYALAAAPYSAFVAALEALPAAPTGWADWLKAEEKSLMAALPKHE